MKVFKKETIPLFSIEAKSNAKAKHVLRALASSNSLISEAEKYSG
jgi:hypothetical protein